VTPAPPILPVALLNPLRDLMEKGIGIVIDDAKIPHLSGVVDERTRALGLCDAWEYLLFLLRGPDSAAELRTLARGLLVGETSFFRTPGLFDVFEKRILPEQSCGGTSAPIPVWSAGCSSGEEAYTIAMAALEWSCGRHEVPVRVRATDIHRDALERAREGVYAVQALQAVPERMRAAYFEPAGNGRFRVADVVRRLVYFEELNLMDLLSLPSSSVRYAAIFCRNVMIYFRPETTRRLVERFHGCLAEGGVLFLGHSETLWGITDAFALEQSGGVFYYRKTPPAASPFRLS
jgi:chemotaxis protein methyltransferase CheR